MLDARLQDATERAARWLRLCSMFRQLGYDQAASHLEQSINTILANATQVRWPPLWWRLGLIDASFSDMSTWLFRVDAEGYFYSNDASGYVPERAEILRIGEELHAVDEQAKRTRNRHQTR